MGLRGEIPSTSKPMYCRMNIGEGKNKRKCGAVAHDTVSGTVMIFDKLVNVKWPVCEEHLEKLSDPNTNYSIGNFNGDV